MGHPSKRSLTNPLRASTSQISHERTISGRSVTSDTASLVSSRPVSTPVPEKAPILPEIDLQPLDFALTRNGTFHNKRTSWATKRASIATKRASIATNPDVNYGLDMFDVRLSYNAGRRSLIRDRDEVPDFSQIPDVPDVPADLRVMQSSKIKEVLGMESGEETEVERDGALTPDSGAALKEEEEQVAPEYIHGWKLLSVMTAITVACFLYLLDASILVTAIPKITSEFHSLTDIGWYGATYTLASASLQPLSGKFYTFLNAKWAFLAFFCVFEIGNLICGLAQSSTMIIIGRTVAGAGASGLTNGSFAIITACAPMEKRPQLMGIMIGVCQIGLVAGPLIGGALTEYASWRWCFYINLPVGAITILAFLLINVPDKRKFMPVKPGKLTFKKMDAIGFALFAPASVMILLALEFGGNRFAWKSATIIGLFIGGVVQAILFFFWESRMGIMAMIPLSIIKKRQVWTASVASMFMYASMLGAGYYLPVYFQTVRGLSPLHSGVSMLPAIVTQLVLAVICGGLVQRVGYYMPFMVVSGAVAAIANGLVTLFNPHTSTVEWAAFQALLGVGRGLALQMPVIAIQAHTPPELASIATATMVLFQTFFSSVFLAIINTLFNSKLKSELTKRLPEIGAQKIIDAGAIGISSVVPKEKIPQVLESYSLGVNDVFYAVTAICVLMFFASFGMGWTDIRKKAPQKKESEENV